MKQEQIYFPRVLLSPVEKRGKQKGEKNLGNLRQNQQAGQNQQRQMSQEMSRGYTCNHGSGERDAASKSFGNAPARPHSEACVESVQ